MENESIENDRDTSDKNREELCLNMLRLRQFGRYYDVTLQSGLDNKKIRAHRLTLHAANEYFKTLFTSPLNNGITFDDNNQPVFIIGGVSGYILEILITFCYRGEMTTKIDDDNVVEILAGARMLQFNQIDNMCVKHLKDTLQISNCLSVWLVADQFDLTDIADKAFNMVIWNFKKVIKEDEFLDMRLKPLQQVLSHDDINVHSEEQIFEAIILWIEFEKRNRMCLFPKLIKIVRLNHLKASFLDDRVAPYAQQNGFESTYLAALNKTQTHRSHTKSPIVLDIFDGDHDKQSFIIQYSPVDKKPLEVHPVPYDQNGRAVILVDNRILYFIGGGDTEQTKRKVSRIDIDSWETFDLKSMRVGKGRPKLACIRNQIYVFDYSVNSFERYDINSNEWYGFDPTNTIYRPQDGRWHSEYKLCAYRDLIYKILIVKEYVSNSAEEPRITCYNPASNTWHAIDENRVNYFLRNIFVHNDCLYIIWVDKYDIYHTHSESIIDRFDVDDQKFVEVDLNLNNRHRNKIRNIIPFANYLYFTDEHDVNQFGLFDLDRNTWCDGVHIDNFWDSDIIRYSYAHEIYMERIETGVHDEQRRHKRVKYT